LVHSHKLESRHLPTAAAKTALVFLALALMARERIGAADLNDPPVLTSRNGTLDVLMVARPQFLPFTGQPAGYAYEICQRPNDPAARRCPVSGQKIDLHTCPVASDPAVSPYGGVRLELTPGDTLRVRLVNCLPPAVDAKHAADDPLLNSNPTNLHTHGLIVEPRRADDPDDPFGDYIFVVDLPHGIKPPAATSTIPMHTPERITPGISISAANLLTIASRFQPVTRLGCFGFTRMSTASRSIRLPADWLASSS
jgi:hypothetical protein